MSNPNLGLAAVALVIAISLPRSAMAADPGLLRQVTHGPTYHFNDACGCVHFSYDYHRELQYTYGPRVDPRSFDQTEPYFYYGAVKAYSRFW
jgi:hypothetical protein